MPRFLRFPPIRSQILLFGAIQCFVILLLLSSAPARSSVELHTRQHFLAAGSAHATTVYDTHGTEVYPVGHTNGDKHGTIRWTGDGKYADTRKTYALFGLKLVKGNPGRIFNFHNHPAGTGGWRPPVCKGSSTVSGVSPVAIDYFGSRGLEVVTQPNLYRDCGGTGDYHFQIMSPSEVESRRGQWIYLWLEVTWGRNDGSTPVKGGVRLWVAGEETPRVDRQGINTHYYAQDMVTFWQAIYQNTNVTVDTYLELVGPRFGRTPRGAYEDVPSFYHHWGGAFASSEPAGSNWNTTAISPRPQTEPAIPASIQWSDAPTQTFAVGSSIASGSTLQGAVAWTATPSGKTASSVTFSVDGLVVATDTSAPFTTSLDTTKLSNGSHVFRLDATASDGTKASASTTANVNNPFSLELNLTDGQTVNGSTAWTATASGKTASRVEFSIDGTLIGTDTSAPFAVSVDTTLLANGSHVFRADAFASDGSKAVASVSVNVDNAFTVDHNLTDHQTLSGSVAWSVTTAGKTVSRVDFSVDGEVVGTDTTAPYSLAFDTRRLANGDYSFSATAVAADASTASTASVVEVLNPSESRFSVTQNVSEGARVAGDHEWVAEVSGRRPNNVTFLVDGTKIATAAQSPYVTRLDTRKLSDGPHAFTVVARAAGGAQAETTARAIVANGASPPAGEPPSAFGVSQNIVSGQSLSGLVPWSASTSGQTATRVEFYVDGRLASTKTHAPYRYGDGKGFDTRALADGSHTLSVKAYVADGKSAGASATVSVSNHPTAPTPSIVSSIRDGQTLQGRVPWTIEPSGVSVSRIEFFVDSKLEWTERIAPYVFGGDEGVFDTTTLANGSHRLAIRAYTVAGDVVSWDATVSISNNSEATPSIVSSIRDGQTLQGRVRWTVEPSGVSVSRIEFFVDSKLEWTERIAPYVFGGDEGVFDTTTLANGSHRLDIRVYTATGSSITFQVAVTVSNQPIVSSIVDSQRISGLVRWTVEVHGFTAARVEFVIDERLMWTERVAPYSYGGDDRQLDTSVLSKGRHVFEVRAIGTDGVARKLAFEVTVK